MFIVLEGLDKQGKSSLAKHIALRHGIGIKKFSKPEGDPYIEYMEYLQNAGFPSVLDRFYLGELVYGPVKRGVSGLNKWQFRNIEMLLAMRNPLLIYAFTSKENTVENFKKEHEEYALEKDIDPLIEGFNKAIDKSQFTWHKYNYLEDPNYEKIDLIIDQWWKQTYKYLDLIEALIPARTLGNFFAETLILGEISNIDLEQEQYKKTNVAFANGPSAELLYKSIPYSKVAISNVRKAHVGGYIKYLENELQLPKLKQVICLGNKAYDMFMESQHLLGIRKKIKVIKTFHPAFILRGKMPPAIYERELSKLII